MIEHKCTECGKPIAKAKRVYKGARYCPACYKRWFVAKTCTLCKRKMRAHKHDLNPVCMRCQRLRRRCLRCNRLVPRAGLIIEGKAVCPSCARYYKDPQHCPNCGRQSFHLARAFSLGFDEPVCEKCRRAAQETCSICRKHRPVHARDEDGKPICKKCEESGRSSHACPDCGKEAWGSPHAACEECQIKKRLYKRYKLNLERLETKKGRALFREFYEWFKERHTSPKACGRLDKYSDFFEKIDKKIFLSQKELAGDELARIFTGDHLRGATTPQLFLLETQSLSVDNRKIEEFAESRRITKIIKEAEESGFLPLIAEFHEDLLDRDPPLAPHTIRVYLRSALSFLKASGAKQLADISPPLAKKILSHRPGLRASASAFFSFVNKRYGYLLESPGPKRTPPMVAEKKLGETLGKVLRRLEDDGLGEREKTALTAYAFSKLYGIPLRNILRIRKKDLSNGNSVKLILDGCVIQMDGKLTKRMGIPAHEIGVSESYIFEGRIPGRPLSASAVGYWVKSISTATIGG